MADGVPRRLLARRERRVRAHARGRRRARRADAHRRQLVREPDVPVPGRGAGRARWPRCSRGVLKAGIKLVRRALLQGVPVRGGVLPAVRPPVPRRAHDAARPRSAASTGSTTITQALDEGFAFVQIGRALLREPELVHEMQKDAGARGAVHPLQQVHADDLHAAPAACSSSRLRLEAEVLLEVPVQVDDPALLGRRDREVREPGLVHARAGCARSS